MFDVHIGPDRLTYKLVKFSGGELHPRIYKALYRLQWSATIKANLHSSDDLMELALLVDAMRRELVGKGEIELVCPYLPYARQDRVCAPGEALGLRVCCDFINGLNFNRVTVWDVHSDVSLALLNNVVNIHQHEFVRRIPTSNCVLVAPDAGAIKKTLETAQMLSLPMVRADKIRSVVDGSITGTTVYSEHIGNKDFLIVDDICDGGRTFIELAKVLRPLTTGKVLLYVTHGIFSKELDVFNGLIDHVFTANLFHTSDLSHSLLTVI